MKRFPLTFLASIVVFGGALIEAQSPSEGPTVRAPAPTPVAPQVLNRSPKDAKTAPVYTDFPTPLPLNPERTKPLPKKPSKHSHRSNLTEQSHVPIKGGAGEDHSPMIDQTQLIDQVIRDQLKALNEGDPSHAYYAFGSDEFKRTVSLETFKQFVMSNRILSVNRLIQIEKPTFQGVAAKVKVKLTSGSEAVRVEYELILEDNFWKVNRLEVFRTGF